MPFSHELHALICVPSHARISEGGSFLGPDSWVADYVSIRITSPDDANRCSDPSVGVDLDMHGGKRRWFHPSRCSRFASALVQWCVTETKKESGRVRACVCMCVWSVHDANPGWNREMELGEKEGEGGWSMMAPNGREHSRHNGPTA